MMFLVIGLGLGFLLLLGNLDMFPIWGRLVIVLASVVIIYFVFFSGGSQSDCPDPSDCGWGR